MKPSNLIKISPALSLQRAEVPHPMRSSAGAAGVDLRYAGLNPVILANGERAIFPTGYKFELPEGTVGLVCPRSGLAFDHGITVLNAPGIIDEDFRGEVKVMLVNLGKIGFIVAPGDRIAQLVLLPVLFANCEQVAELNETDRGENGFGSTGVS